jgi:hypothetical protein
MFSIIGVATFGVPAIGFGIYQLIGADAAVLGRHRYIWAATSFVAGLIGIACSSRWWLGVSWWA